LKIQATSRLADVARVVSQTLLENGILAVLTGGACASLYTRGAYMSSDLDFVIGDIPSRVLDRVMQTINFTRVGNIYRHPETEFFVEFLPGPLGIGRDLEIKAVPWGGKSPLLVLSPTDSCRDRLAAFYLWNDRQSLRVAVRIALRHTIDLETIRRWSAQESRLPEFEEFVLEVKRPRKKTSGSRK
jgi:hypothetical protein